MMATLWKTSQTERKKKLKPERLAVSEIAENENFLLGIHACEEPNSQCQAQKIIEQLETYNISEDIVGIVFDTTTVNTGHKNGINTSLNLIFDREVLHLACRHHVYKIHIKNVVKIF